MEKLMRPREVAEYVGVSVAQVYRWAASRTIPVWQAKPRGADRFRRQDVEEYIDRNIRGAEER